MCCTCVTQQVGVLWVSEGGWLAAWHSRWWCWGSANPRQPLEGGRGPSVCLLQQAAALLHMHELSPQRALPAAQLPSMRKQGVTAVSLPAIFLCAESSCAAGSFGAFFRGAACFGCRCEWRHLCG